MLNSLLRKITNREFVSGAPALLFLLLFQWTLYYTIVAQNEHNLLPVKHYIKLNSFEDAPDLKLKSSAESGYQTDSVEIVEGHFWDFNIKAQLLVLSIFAVLLFVIFRKMRIYPSPFLVPLFIILTISIFYHNYLGHRIKDTLSISSVESVLCEGKCDSGEKNVVTVQCEVKDDKGNIEENVCKGIADTFITKEKTLKLDRQKMRKKINEALALGIYPAEQGIPVKLDSKVTMNEKDNSRNKYLRASQDSKSHFKYIVWGLILFVFSLITAKLFSKVRDFSDCEFRFVVGFSIAACIGFATITNITSVVEFLKLVAILLTVAGYEKINKNKINLGFYLAALGLEVFLLLYAGDFGNMLILAVIIWLVILLTVPLKKIFLTATPVLLLIVPVSGYFAIKNYKPDSHVLWRLPDTLSGVSNPLYTYKNVADKKTTLEKPFFSTESGYEICAKSYNDKGQITDFEEVRNCVPAKDANNKDLGFQVCDTGGESSYADETGKFKCSSKDYGRITPEQTNTDPRLAMFAILKDGFAGGGYTGFKENTFLLNNHYMYTDFVFCGLIAFFGIRLALLTVLSLIILIWNCNIKPKECGNNYKHFLYSNIMVVILAAQAIIHIGGNLNVFPFTGVILPFLSRGGASTLVSFVTLGFALGGLVSDDFTYSRFARSIMSVTGKIREPLKKLCLKFFHKSERADSGASSILDDNNEVNYEYEE